MNVLFLENDLTPHDPLLSLVALACYVAFVFFVFCDGFQLRMARKILWAVYFLLFSFLTIFSIGEYDLALIISLSSLMALALSLFQKRENRLKGK